MQLIEIQNCPIDGSSGSVRYENIHDAFFGTCGKWTYRRNGQTGHLWLNPRPTGESVADLYTNYYTHTGDNPETAMGLWQQSIALALSDRLGYPKPEKSGALARLVSVLPTVGAAAELEMMRIPASETGRLLDVGCGGGAFLRRMRKAGWSVTGTEPDTQAAARLEAQEGFPVYSSLEELLLKQDQYFDVIVLSHVIEHVPDPLQTLQQLSRLLSKGGRLLLTTPNAVSLGSRIFGSSWRGLEPPRHFNVFTPDSLRQALNSEGFQVQRMSTDVRLARGIWYLSYLARAGARDLECVSGKKHTLLKIAGYIFQIFEAGAVKFVPTLGEEVFCEARFNGRDPR